MNSVLSFYLLASLSLYCLLLTVGKSEGQFVPGRCECYDTKITVSGPLSDLKVTLKGLTCNTDQIIVVMKRTSEPVCVNPMGQLGKQLLRQKQRKLRRQSKESKRRATPIPALG
uniref:Chemokine interleukin-8-like domain-containing protein n=1 Tax=Oncorhynchus tshawytscha TaxID=74940 RepID=A0A8C8MNE3_ONCTS